MTVKDWDSYDWFGIGLIVFMCILAIGVVIIATIDTLNGACP